MKKIKFTVFPILFLIGSILTVNCNIGRFGTNQKSGSIKSESRNLAGFKAVKTTGTINLEIAVQTGFSIEIETDEKLLPLIKTDTENKTLIISARDEALQNTKINIKISMPELTDLDISGASAAEVAKAKTDWLKLEASGASKIRIDGQVKSLEAIANGASSIDAENLKTENARAEVNGASSITVSPTDLLEAFAFGSSSVVYTGEPKSVKQNSSGAGLIRKK